MEFEKVAALLYLLYEAGKIALSYSRHAKVLQKPDASLLTQADVEISEFLTHHLRINFPTFQVISEEQGSQAFCDGFEYTWVIDPLDGTTAFVHGLPEWGIAVGLMQHDEPCFGMFYMPLLDLITLAEKNKPAQIRASILAPDSHPLSVSVNWGMKGFLAVSSAHVHRDFRLNVRRIRTVGSASTALTYVARGIATAALLPKARLWDLVAGSVILQQAGGALCYLSGQPINYGALYNGQLAPEPVIAAHPRLLPELQAAVELERATNQE